MNRIELIYDEDCPNVQQARQNLRDALALAGLPGTWKEWDRNAPDSPDHARSFGSPTILVNGKDIAGFSKEEGNNCRVYPSGEGGLQGVPPVERIVLALGNSERNRWKNVAGVFPAVGVGLLPKMTCPACWPAYSWLLGVLGLEFINFTPWLFPITTAFLALSVFILACRGKQRRGYGPFFLGLMGSGLLIAGKFQFNRSLITNSGILILMLAFLWNGWPRRKGEKAICPACLEPEQQT